jgi:hypothetical protein
LKPDEIRGAFSEPSPELAEDAASARPRREFYH